MAHPIYELLNLVTLSFDRLPSNLRAEFILLYKRRERLWPN